MNLGRVGSTRKATSWPATVRRTTTGSQRRSENTRSSCHDSGITSSPSRPWPDFDVPMFRLRRVGFQPDCGRVIGKCLCQKLGPNVYQGHVGLLARVGQHAVARIAPFIGQNSRYRRAVDERLGGASEASGPTRANDPSYTSQSQRPALGNSPEFACQFQLPSPLVGFWQSVE